MPYVSKAQRGFIHARASEGVGWAKRFVAEADRMKQPTQHYVPQSRLAREADKQKRARR